MPWHKTIYVWPLNELRVSLLDMASPGAKRRRLDSEDAAYYAAYGDLTVHETMLRDSRRTLAYKEGLERCAHLFRGGVVLDVGSGTGVLSVFAARLGARRVYAVEPSSLATLTEAVVRDNGLAGVITVIPGRVEDLLVLPDGCSQVDIIVSEWMGYSLLFEGMLPSVLTARERFLKPGGLMLPSHATIWAAPLSDEARFDAATSLWHSNPYGIDMSAMAPHALSCAFSRPVIDCFAPETMLTWPIPLRRIDCLAVKADELTIKCDFSAPSLGSGTLNGLLLWFDVEFHTPESLAAEQAAEQAASCERGSGGLQPCKGVVSQKRLLSDSQVVRLSTAPDQEATHWMNTGLMLTQPLAATQDGEITGKLMLAPHAQGSRFLQMKLTLTSGGESRTQDYEML
jgi:protein arginine N-methyltransferase 6